MCINLKYRSKIVYIKRNSIYYKGFTLIEVIVVVAVFGIIAAIAVPRFAGVIKDAKKQVCYANCLQLEAMYQADLILNDSEHSEIIFSMFLNEYVGDICPDSGEIFYTDGKVNCNLHDEFDGDDESVLYF